MNYPANTAGGSSSSGQPPVNDTRYVAPPPPPPALGLDMQYGPGGFYSQGSAHLYGTGSVSAYGPPLQYPVGRYMSSLDLHGAIQGSVCLPTGQPISTTSTTPAVFVNTKGNYLFSPGFLGY
ncbi:hypothetical protein H4S07_002052 [Coemansia furcata]|uniref:Uncharacterized protein n=1 Tax=Coemansia furcata TaxID=417177 RepID=A0ACC1LM22_9FUNG|nr:hypothetical protein H4S07_002052 [Coemansia furcata]